MAERTNAESQEQMMMMMMMMMMMRRDGNDDIDVLRRRGGVHRHQTILLEAAGEEVGEKTCQGARPQDRRVPEVDRPQSPQRVQDSAATMTKECGAHTDGQADLTAVLDLVDTKRRRAERIQNVSTGLNGFKR
jgi:hypothetical protein